MNRNETFNLEKLARKYPLVPLSFMLKNTKEQNIENNQEIHKINKKLLLLENSIQELLQSIKTNRTD